MNVRRLLAARAELLFVAALVLLVALRPKGLPFGIVGLGVVAGSVLGLHAVGIVLLYTRTRILSFAQFGLGIAASVLFYAWITYNQWLVLADGVCGCLGPKGSTMSKLQHNPDTFREFLLDHHPWALAVNLVISGALAILLAADAGRNAFRTIGLLFARAPRIVPTIATLSFAIMLSGGAGLLGLRTTTVFGYHAFGWFPYGPRAGTGRDGTPAVPEGTFHAPGRDALTLSLSGGVRLHLFEVLAVVAGIAALAPIALRFERGRRGLDSRATASNLERAATLGVDVLRESRRPWLIAGALSGVAGVLTTTLASSPPVTGLDMGALTIVMAAVVLARTSSAAWAMGATVLLSVLDQAMFWSFGSRVQFQGSLVVIVGVALVLQRRRVGRAEREGESVFTSAPEPRPVVEALRRLPGVHGFLRGSVVLAGLAFLGFPLLTTPRQLSLGIGVVAYLVLGLSLLVVSGWGGQVSLGQLGLAAVGAYVAAITGSAGVPMPIALVLGALAGGVVAPLVGLPALRLPGPFVSIMTLAFALAVPAVLLNERLLGGPLPDALPRPVVLGVDFASDRSFYWFCLAVAAGAVAAVTGLRRSRLRRALIAARDNQQSASAFGLDVTRVRLEGFAVAGVLAGLGGGLIAYANGGVQPDTFSAAGSVILFLIVVVGGISAVSGPVVGAALYSLVLSAGAAWATFLNGLGTIIILAVRPGGLASILSGLRDAVVRVILHLQGHEQLRFAGVTGDRIAIADRGAQATVVPVRYRLVGDGFGPVEGTRLRSVDGVAASGPTTGPATEAEAGAPAGDQPTLLACHRLDVAYGGATAVSGVTLEVASGEVLAVVGLNGAGKTSLLRALAGLEPAAHGTVEVAGLDVTAWFPQFRAKAGLAFVPGGAAVLGALTVRENLVVAGGPDHLDIDADIAEVVRRFPALGDRLDAEAGALSGGEQQVLGIAQALVRRPAVLLVDELSLGLSPEALASVLEVLTDAAAAGAAIVVVEQSISAAMSIADTAVFLESGRVRYQGPAGALREHPELFASVAFGAGGGGGGGSEVARARARLRTQTDAVLQVAGVSAAYGSVQVVDDVHLEVAAGEVVGVLGPNGAGKTSLFDCLSGVLAPSAGTVTLLGEDITGLPTHQRAARGLMRSFQSVRLFPSLSVRDCIAVALETRLTVKSAAFAGLWLPPARNQERRVTERVDSLLELLSLEAVADEQLGSLSLGTRRMVDLACQLAARPKVLLLDEPASGLAQAETELLGPLVGRISADLDCAVLIIEHNVSVLASVAHRLVALRAGAVIAEGDPTEVLADPAVHRAYFGDTRTDPVPALAGA